MGFLLSFMKNNINVRRILPILFLLSACSSDEENFRSVLPTFSEIAVQNLDDESESLVVGKPFVLTAEQRTRGKLLYKAVYSWEVENAHDWQHRYKKTVVYDHQSEDPTDTITATAPGSYNVTMTAEYYLSGTAPAGTSAVKQRVQLSRRIRIEEP